MVCGTFSYEHKLHLKVVNGTLNSQMYRDEILESDVRPALNSPEGRKMVRHDDNARPQRARNTEEYKSYRKTLIFHGRACRLHLNRIEH